VRRLTCFAAAAAVVLLAATPALASAGRESQVRRRLTAATQRTAAAKSLAVRGKGELRESGRRLPFYRLEERSEDMGALKTDARRFPPRHWTKQPTYEVVTVGNQGWYRASSGLYREATFGAGVTTGFEREFTDLERALATGKDLKALGADRYELNAPSSTFDGPEAGAGPIRLVVTLSAAGYVHRLRRIEADGPELVVIAETLTDFGHSFDIAPPPAEATEPAPVKEVTNQLEFSELLGPQPFGND
jgi:hypothetical protein